ncbi:ComF family protein, partial [Enterococcus faecium]|uniref:ComF family protein n=1 Tax=Enterococcus faecium TaxID=1352 RepID=UPI003CC59A7D
IIGNPSLNHRYRKGFYSLFKTLQQNQKDYPAYIYCPIPLSEKRWLERGFNQVSEMLKAAKIPFQMLLKREQHLLAQAKNTRKERLEMPQPFELAVPLSKNTT